MQVSAVATMDNVGAGNYTVTLIVIDDEFARLVLAVLTLEYATGYS